MMFKRGWLAEPENKPMSHPPHELGTLGVRVISAHDERRENWYTLALLVGVIWLLSGGIWWLLSWLESAVETETAMPETLDVWLIQLPTLLLVVGIMGLVSLRPRSHRDLLTFDRGGLRLGQGGICPWQRLQLRIELRMNAGFLEASTRNAAAAVRAVLHVVHEDGRLQRICAYPDPSLALQVNGLQYADPAHRFRHELAALLAHLPADVTAPVLPEAFHKRGLVYYPLRRFGRSVFWLTLFGVLALLTGGGLSGLLSTAGGACLLVALLLLACGVDRVVLAKNGLYSWRYGRLGWGEIASLQQASASQLAWARIELRDRLFIRMDELPADWLVEQAEGSMILFPIDTQRAPWCWDWSYRPDGAACACRFLMYCNEAIRRHGLQGR
ncbi:hypothetical protein [Chitinolyticbacter albus]|uniref:hypothetical protein n=1 Tax=Chitinolyticbacter albus TaxID=2961951 RepID=UPI00210DB540|nr:hypothetical protein [Chitinolyticbacter albus]